MADIPVPRSYEQIRGDIIDSFIARTGISSLKVGSPILAIIEAVAQSQFRNTKDVFGLLEASSLDYATGDALTQLAADEGITRKPAVAAFGYVTFIDNSFSKVSTQLVKKSPISQTAITVVSVTGFSAGDSISVDGESATIVSFDGTTINLDHALAKPYPIGAEVLLTTSAVRTIPSGTIVSTGNVNFSTTNTYSISSGQTAVTGVPVVCNTTGTGGNVPAKSISKILSATPFEGATVTNYLAFVNGQDQETDAALRDRVRAARRDKQRGTAASIENAVTGAVAYDESKRIVSANLVDTANGKATLYIDDGTGYEGVTTPVGIEVLTASAVGGEKYFELQGGRPVAQCFVEAGLVFPADLRKVSSIVLEVTTSSGPSTLTIPVNNTVFADTSSVTSYEMVSFINRASVDDELVFCAATSSNHTKIILRPTNPDDSSIKVTGDSTNTLQFNLNFPVSTLYLFKNGLLLEEGVGADYALNRNKGQIFLTEQLKSGDTLTAGSVDSRTGIFTTSLSSSAVLSNQYIWVVADAPVTQTAIFQAGDLITHSYNSGTGLMEIGNVAGKFASVQAEDWVVIWDSQLGGIWTKRVASRTSNGIKVESESDLFPSGNQTLAQGGIRVFRTNGVPQKIPVPTFTTLDELVASLNQKLVGIHATLKSDKVYLFTDSFEDTGAVAYLTGTPTVANLFGFSQLNVTQNTNPANYQTSLVSGNSEFAIEEAEEGADPTLADVGKISRFTTGEQMGLRTTQYDATHFRTVLNSEGVIGTDQRRASLGFHLSDTDTITIQLDENTSKVYSFPAGIDGKIVNTALTAQDGTPLPYTAAGYTLNDWAIWSKSAQFAIPSSGQSEDITFTSTHYGPSNPIQKVQYRYPLEAAKTSASYVVDYGTMYVVLPSGPLISTVDPTQKLWLGNYSTTPSKTMELLCGFSGLGYHGGVPSKTTVDIDPSIYQQIDEIFSVGDYMFVQRADNFQNIGNGNFLITDIDTSNPTAIVVTLKDDDGVMPTVQTDVVFSISQNASASSIADFGGASAGSYMYDSVFKQTYRIVSSQWDKVVFAYSYLSFRSDLTGSKFTFFQSDNSQPTTLDNPFFTLSSTSPVTVTRSTEELFNFSVPPDEGEVITDGAVNYVNFGGNALVISKVSQPYDDLVRFVPVTAQNVADWISYNMQNAGIVCVANVDGKVELIRNDTSANASVQASSGSANSISAAVSALDSSSCRVDATSAASFVAGHSVKLTDGQSEETLVVDYITAIDESLYAINFTTAIVNTYTIANTKLVALGKLEFPTGAQATNSDGYKYYAGLIGEANRIVYGDPADPVNYSGFASANANIEVAGPQVKQIKMTIYVKMSGGFTMTDAKAAVRNAAASVINATPVGQSVAYSDVVAAVNSVSGVFSVAIASFSSESPVIPVLAYEKPLVIDLEKDIQVEIAGI